MIGTDTAGRQPSGAKQRSMRRGPWCGLLGLLAILAVAAAACSPEAARNDPRPAGGPRGTAPQAESAAPTPGEVLPEGLEWLTNREDPPFASPEAVPGGTLHLPLGSFPLTFRFVGPDSNGSFRSAILDNHLSLVNIHPNTQNVIPELATHWAYGPDRKTMYFRLDPRARWSDGVPVTAGDFAYTLEFMRSGYIVAPWYNDYYTKEIDRVIIYDDHTIAVVGTKPQPDLHLKLAIRPLPRHYFGRLDEDFIQKYNWAVVPNTGPYQIDRFKKGRYIRFRRKQDWWARDLYYFRHRFNVDTVLFKVIRDPNLQWEYFKKARIDAFPATIPSYWHIKTNIPAVRNGYVHKIWFFNDVPQSAMGFWLNQDRDLFRERNLRYAFAHAMNIEKVIRQVLRNDYFRLEHGYVGYGAYTNPDIRARRYDIGEVERYMKEAGWERGPDGIWRSGGQRFSVELLYSSEEHTQRMVVLKEEAKKAGIELKLARLDSTTAFKKILEKRHDVAFMAWSVSLRPHFWEHFHSVNAHKPQTNNVTNTDDPELDRLIDAYRDSLEEAQRIELAHRIQEKIHEIGPFVPAFMIPYFRELYWRWWRFPDPPATRSSDDLMAGYPFNSTTGGLFWYDRRLHEETLEAMDAGRAFEPVTRVDATYKP